MFQIIDGKKLAEKITAEVTRHIIDDALEPQLAVILVGDDPASHLYVKLKKKACTEAGITLHTYLISEVAEEKEILDTVAFLNNGPGIDAILIQLPLPKKFEQKKIIDAMDYRKDVDGFHKKNLERLLSGRPQHILPGLALAIWTLIATTEEKNYIEKNALIISKSSEFSRPLAQVLTNQHIHCTTATPDDPALSSKTLAADILVVAVGRPKLITADMVKTGATIIDIGINKVDGKTVGDVDFANVAPKTAFITPVPGGVGPMTVAMLLYNTWLLALGRKNKLNAENQ